GDLEVGVDPAGDVVDQPGGQRQHGGRPQHDELVVMPPVGGFFLLGILARGRGGGVGFFTAFGDPGHGRPLLLCMEYLLTCGISAIIPQSPQESVNECKRILTGACKPGAKPVSWVQENCAYCAQRGDSAGMEKN